MTTIRPSVIPALVLLGTVQCAHAQYGPLTYPFESPADPRSVAMGISFVALPADPAALLYNPAGLAGLRGTEVSYAHRRLDLASDGWSIYSVNATVATSFGVFAAQYNREYTGPMSVTTPSYPDGNGSVMSIYAHDLAIGFALDVARGLSLGVAAKYYDYVESIFGPLNGAPPPWTSTPAYLVDFGLTYTLPKLHAQSVIEDSITVGLSFQNIGSQWNVTYHYDPALLFSTPTSLSTQLPEFFRIGLSYAMKVRPAVEGNLSPFAAVVSGEFRTLMDPHNTHYSPETGLSYGGFGLECTIFEILSLRAGVTYKPYSDFESDKNSPSFRYGAGVRFPGRDIGVNIPLSVSLDYTLVPLSWPGILEYPRASIGTARTFSFGLQYSDFP